MGLRYLSPNSGPICFESADVRLVDGVRDIPYEGTLTAVLVPMSSEQGGQYVGLVFDERRTLIVDCLRGEASVRAFRDNCERNQISSVTERPVQIMTPCPPPKNQLQVEDWRRRLFNELRPT